MSPRRPLFCRPLFARPQPSTLSIHPPHTLLLPRNYATFPSKRYIPTSASSNIAVRYRASLSKHPFILFGLPFLFTIVAGSFFLTPATAIRYEKHDRKVRRMSEDERLGIKMGARKVSAESVAEEYYVSYSRLSLI